MRMDDEQYFRSCVAKERQLAQLLGHSNIEECYESAGTLWDKAQALPQWTRDWAACEPLLTQYQLVLSYGTAAADSAELVTVTVGDTSVALVEHPSRERAVMFAIVKEVIRLLEHHRHHHLPADMAESAAPLQPHPYK